MKTRLARWKRLGDHTNLKGSKHSLRVRFLDLMVLERCHLPVRRGWDTGAEEVREGAVVLRELLGIHIEPALQVQRKGMLLLLVRSGSHLVELLNVQGWDAWGAM